ncbi:hypothetical protein C8F01DRAFT_1256708 [Mycena amicta]|nr:hypothetical protein C8F01DRAFT_1256708 [Mycena amicta]
MSFQSAPSKSGIFRIKVLDQDLYIEAVPDAEPSWMRLSARSSEAKQQWLLIRSSAAADQWAIFSLVDNAGLVYTKHHDAYRGHGFPSPTPERLSLCWKITDNGRYSKISAPVNGSDVLDARWGQIDCAVHFWNPLSTDDHKQRFVFEFLKDDENFPTTIMHSALPRRPEGQPALNVDDIQGDIIYHFPKRAENFVFFRISSNRSAFRTALRAFPVSTSKETGGFVYTIAERRIGGSTQTIERIGHQIAFTRMGMNYLGVREGTGDVRFDTHSMRDDKDFLGDQAKWDAVFDKPGLDPVGGSVRLDAGALHGVISIAASDVATCRRATDAVKARFGASIEVISTIEGLERPGKYRGHEHFGYRDGTSQPSLRNITAPKPGQIQVDAGVILMGYKGDPVLDNPDAQPRPAWTKGGTIMVFRKLEQDVDAFNKYLEKNGPRWREFAPLGCPQLTDKEGAELWGARLVGRWKSGAPLALCPFKDDPELAVDPKRNNNFDYRVRNVAGVSPRDHSDRFCPFFSHTRKTVPRNLDPFVQQAFLESSMIVRAGIPYGPEFSVNPSAQRGLLFVCYQSDLDQGFVRQTTGFANNDFFPTTSLRPKNHGQDPIIGGPPAENSSAAVSQVAYLRTPGVAPRSGDQVNFTVDLNDSTVHVTGFAKVKAQGATVPPGVSQDFFVTSHGGEYFFVPSISTLTAWATASEV